MKVELVQVIEKLMSAHNIQTLRITPPYPGLEKFDYGLRKTLDPQFDWTELGDFLLREIPANTLLFAEDTFELKFAFCRVPDIENTILGLGPWTDGSRTQKAMDWAKENLSPAGYEALGEYYNAVPAMPGNALVEELNALVSLLFPGGEYEVMRWHEFLPLHFRPDLRFFTEPPFERELPAALIEQRYEAENEMLDAVSRGDTQAALTSLAQFGRFKFTARSPNPLRDRKNLAIIMNTLLRKAIEQATVHPYYIDRISARYAQRIENLANEEEANALAANMVQEYCTYVQRYSLRSYSPPIQKVINHINLNLDSQLSLKSLAAMCFISPSYLSNLFKQETGQTLTDYINTRRIRRAARRLCTTGESVAAAAERVGIYDVNYFTKIFKKVMGTTPTQYRREHRER